MSLQRDHPLFLALLLILAAASWVMLIWQSSMMKSMGMGLTMGMGATLFLAIWVVMMIAMMFPTTAPMNLVFARVQRERPSSRRPWVSPWIFVGAYLLVWTLFGVVAYLGALGKLIFHLMGALAEFERDLIRERTNAGLAAARARGRVGGRPRKLKTSGKVLLARQMFADQSHSIPEICAALGISRATLYRYVKKPESAT